MPITLSAKSYYLRFMTSAKAAKQTASPDPPKLGLRERKQKLTEDAICDAAIDLRVEKGYDYTTIDEIAEAAFVSRRSFFRYFESKSGLMAHPVANMANSLAQAFAACPKMASPAELLRYVVSTLGQQAVEEARTAEVTQSAVRYPAAQEALLSRVSAVQGEIKEAFGARFKDAFTVRVLSSLTLSVLSLATHHWFTRGQISRANMASHLHYGNFFFDRYLGVLRGSPILNGSSMADASRRFAGAVAADYEWASQRTRLHKRILPPWCGCSSAHPAAISHEAAVC